MSAKEKRVHASKKLRNRCQRLRKATDAKQPKTKEGPTARKQKEKAAERVFTSVSTRGIARRIARGVVAAASITGTRVATAAGGAGLALRGKVDFDLPEGREGREGEEGGEEEGCKNEGREDEVGTCRRFRRSAWRPLPRQRLWRFQK